MQATSFFMRKPTKHNLFLLFICGFLIRAFVFGLYVQHEERYCQADTPDYHACAASLYHLQSFKKIKSKEPIFWRTPGYPLFLAPFFALSRINQLSLASRAQAHKTALWVQVFLCSFLPILIFFLALQLTGVLALAWSAAWISVIHLGFVLASNFLLSDALASLLFVLFLIFFYKSFVLIFEPVTTSRSTLQMIRDAVVSALFLAAYTWMRPNGQFTVWVAAGLLLFGACAQAIKLKKIGLFLFIFFAALSPWYIRNYQLTGHLFFCPMQGPYLQVFPAPKLIRRIADVPLEVAHNYMMYLGDRVTHSAREQLKLTKVAPYLSKEYAIRSVCYPLIVNHPLWFLYDWCAEVAKSTFDLYASQLVKFADGSYRWDPMEEFLGEKFAKALYRQPMHPFMRLIVWLEFLWAIFKWIGLLGGCWLFLLQPLVQRFRSSVIIKKIGFVWLKTGLLIATSLMQTGGFGYARLRLPIEPLMIILSLTFYWYVLKKNK